VHITANPDREAAMNLAVTIFRRDRHHIVCLSLGCMLLAWVPTILWADSPTAVTPTPTAHRHRRPGARDLNWRPEYVEGAGVIAGHIAATFEQLTDCSDHTSRTAPATFMQEYAGELARLCVPAARLARCQSVPGAARYELTSRLTGTNAVQLGVAFGCNRVGLIETVTFDRPVRLPGGATSAAGAPLPIETVMRALALLRRNGDFGTEDLVITRAATKVSYASQDATKAKFSYMVRGRAPTAYTSFSSTDIVQFVITPEPLFDTNVVAHAFYRLPTGVVPGNQPKYLHYFISLNAAHRQHKNGYFLATLHDGMVDFTYKMAFDNQPGDIMTGAQYDALRTCTRTNQPLRGLCFGRYMFGIGTETHTVSNVPLFGRVTKGSSSVTSVKLKAH